jgi:chitodextrinase
VAYWATDQNTLYQCTATNTWTAYYTPYTYPHPLTGSDTTPPSVPTNLAATAFSSVQINLSWTASTDNVGVTGYKIFRNGTQVGTSATTAYQDTGLSPSTLYSYTVSAYDASGNNSAQSSSASATTQASSTTPPSITSAASATGTAGHAFSYQITATNTPTSYGATGLPAGISVNTATGLISGTPTAAGTSPVTLSASNSGGTGTAPLTITISPSIPPRSPYSTTFPLTENPISESLSWINGKTVGLDWSDVATTPGLAFGTQIYTGNDNDSTAVLTGTWGPNQTAQATVHTVNQQSGSVYEEVELRLRTTITAHSITGYEFNYRCTADGSQYVQIVRWNGALNSFTLLDSRTGPGLHNGDVVKATISGSTLTTYINNVVIFSVTDSTYSNGSPGIGFFLQGATGVNSDFGFTSFSASDGTKRRRGQVTSFE